MINKLFNREPKYAWKLILRHEKSLDKEELAELSKLLDYITRYSFGNLLDITLEIPSKTEKEVEDIKSRMIDLDWEVILCANKGLSTKTWWGDLLDKFSTYNNGDKKSYKD
jgi:hypothetical protein